MLLEVKVTPNAKNFRLFFKDGWRASVISPPDKGKANKELKKQLSEIFSCQVQVIRGASSRHKVLEVDLDEDEFKKRSETYVKAQDLP